MHKSQWTGHWKLQDINKSNAVCKEHKRTNPNYQTRREIKTNRTTRVVFSPTRCKTFLFLKVYNTGDKNSSGVYMHKIKEPDTDNYKKLKSVMQYLRNTKELTLTIKPDEK